MNLLKVNMNMKKLIKNLKQFWDYLTWIEEQRMKAAEYTGSAGPLL